MVIVIDNYDSFTYNLVQYLRELGQQVRVFRNDEVDLQGLEAAAPERLLISPGPGTPEQAGITVAAIQHFAGKLPIMGVCLGHQAIAHALGGKIVRAQRLMHGRTSEVHHEQTGVLTGLPTPFVATRYHSLLVDADSLPQELHVNAWTDQGEIMGLAHQSLALHGVQFHPESFLSEYGHAILRNFVGIANAAAGRAPSDPAA